MASNTSSELAAGWQLQTQFLRASLLHRDSMGIVLLLTEQNKRHLWKFCFGVPSATFRLSLHVFWNLTNSWDFPEQSLEATLLHFPLFKSRSLLRDEPILGAELRGWTLGLAPAAQHVRARTTTCSSNGWTLGLVPAAQHVRARTTPCSSNGFQDF